jgi:hypothetical protein
MARPFKGTINLDISDSPPDWMRSPRTRHRRERRTCSVQVVFDVADHAYLDVERELEAAIARD